MKVVKNLSTHFLRFLHHPVNEEPDESCVKVRVDVSNLLPSESSMSEGSGKLVAMKRIPNKNYFDVREHETKIYG